MPLWSQFHLMRPEWLWALLPAVLLAALLWRVRSNSGGWSEIIAPELLPYLVGDTAGSRGPNLLPFIALGWILAALAASGPSWNKIPQPVHQKQDAMVLVLDLSYSMKAADLAPSRLNRARQKLLDLLALRREGQTGLIAYAGDSHIVTPLTDDNPTIANLLPVLGPDMMPLPGSNSPAAIRQAIKLLHSAGVSQGQILLVTDGVDRAAGDVIAGLIKDSGMQLTVLGVGTSSGAPIPMTGGGFLKDQSGAIVIPALDSAALTAVAKRSGGRYLDIQLDNSDLKRIVAGPIALPGQEQTLALDRTADSWEDQGYLLVLVLLVLVLPLFRRGWLLGLLPMALLMSPDPASAQAWDSLWLTPDQQGQRAMQAGDPKQAAALFENPDWAGTAAYEGEDYAAAVKHFSNTDNGDTWYNRGNALAREGKLDEAIAAYKESLALQPDQVDAQDNLALLEQMQQQEQEQQDGDSEDSESEDDNSEQQSDDQQPNDQEQNSDQDQESSGQPDDQQPPADDSQQDQQQPPEQSDQGEDQDSPEQEQEQEQPQEPSEEEQQSPAEPENTEGSEQEQAAAKEAQMGEPEDPEKDQAMEQWLRRVPDDPSGLLREKFRYESRQRQDSGETQNNESYW